MEQDTMLEFTTHDRCDACSSQAHARASSGDLRVFFCVHHLSANFDALMERGWVVEEDEFSLSSRYPDNHSYQPPV